MRNQENQMNNKNESDEWVDVDLVLTSETPEQSKCCKKCCKKSCTKCYLTLGIVIAVLIGAMALLT